MCVNAYDYREMSFKSLFSNRSVCVSIKRDVAIITMTYPAKGVITK